MQLMPDTRAGSAPSRSRRVLLVLLAVGLAWAYVEHRVHLFGVLPYLFLLACPLMHLFMHHGRGSGANGAGG